jgi:hypothetical protein
MKLDNTETFHEESTKAVKALYEIALLVAKGKNLTPLKKLS